MKERLWIAEMLRGQRRHISFHTPGHKRAGADITELDYSDCLLSPRGVLKAAQEDIARILGAARSFILTDGSTSGVFSMLYCLKAAGKASVAAPVFSHPSVRNACNVFELKWVPVPQKTRFGIPLQPTSADVARALDGADALLLTSPDYYGNFPDLAKAAALCKAQNKPLVIDGAHGGHLHFVPERYAGSYADLWVDGMHKSLPALTQGAVVSAKAEQWAGPLESAVKLFRTSSPSYPIMASVEYAVKYPRNVALENAAERFKTQYGCVNNGDWSKLLVPFGGQCGAAQAYSEGHGVYPEFNDGNYLLFYLSPCTTARELKTLGKLLEKMPRGEVGEDAPAGSIPMYGEER